jgi:hypothetical protein
MTDLNSLINPPPGFTWVGANAINNHDQVIVVATSIPEPEAYALLLAGLGLIGSMAARNCAGIERIGIRSKRSRH